MRETKERREDSLTVDEIKDSVSVAVPKGGVIDRGRSPNTMLCVRNLDQPYDINKKENNRK